MCDHDSVAEKSAAGAPGKEEIKRLARLIRFAFRRVNKRALIMGGEDDLTSVLIDGTFDLVKVAGEVLRSPH